jgi:hypothetical protein
MIVNGFCSAYVIEWVGKVGMGGELRQNLGRGGWSWLCWGSLC